MQPEAITADEMRKATAPSRRERIMLTPLSEVLKKDSWDDIDIEILIMNRNMLDAETLAKLGITTPDPLTASEVNAATANLGPVPQEPAQPAAPETVEGQVTPQADSTQTPVVENNTPAPEASGLPTDTDGQVVDNQPVE